MAIQNVRARGPREPRARVSGPDGSSETDSSWTTLTGGAKSPRPGQTAFDEIELRSDFIGTRKAMQEWIDASARGKPRDRERTVTVTLTPIDINEPTVTYVFYNALVTRYVFPPLVLDDPCPPSPVEKFAFTYSRFASYPLQ